jgi:hypothetical protein
VGLPLPVVWRDVGNLRGGRVEREEGGGRVKNTYNIPVLETEKIVNLRLDRRCKHYAIIDNQLCSIAEWTTTCSGCTSSYAETGSVLDRGDGCRECGYTGKRRVRMWCPVVLDYNTVELEEDAG